MKLLISMVLFCGSSVFASSQFGLFMVVKGDVKILKIDKKEALAKVGSKIEEGESVMTGADSRAKIVMSDRNVIYVSPDSKMQISKYVNDTKSGVKGVELKLDQGKIRNNVEQIYDGDKNKFEVKTPTAVAGVRGTQFVTSFDKGTQKTKIVTIAGSVNLSTVANGKVVGAPVEVKKDQTSTAGAGAPPEVPKTLPKAEMQEIEKSSTAATKPADSDKKEDSTNSAPKQASSEGGDTSTADRAPASTRSGSEPSMIDKSDMSTDAAKDIQPRAGTQPAASVPRPPTVPMMQNPLVRDAVRDSNAKTKVIIRPK